MVGQHPFQLGLVLHIQTPVRADGVVTRVGIIFHGRVANALEMCKQQTDTH
jgi:hypothetical protein